MTKPNQQVSHKKTLSIILLIFAAIAVVTIYFGVIQHQQKVRPQDIKINGAFLVPPKQISDFQLTDTHGKALTKENLKGRWTIMFFGFTNCGLVCPTTLSSLNKMYNALQKELPESKLPQVVFVTVDPERDTPKKLESYMKAFNSNFVGATGDASMLSALEKQLHIVAIKVQTDQDYYYDHSAELLLFNPDAQVQAYMSYPHKPEQLVKDYKLILNSVS